MGSAPVEGERQEAAGVSSGWITYATVTRWLSRPAVSFFWVAEGPSRGISLFFFPRGIFLVSLEDEEEERGGGRAVVPPMAVLALFFFWFFEEMVVGVGDDCEALASGWTTFIRHGVPDAAGWPARFFLFGAIAGVGVAAKSHDNNDAEVEEVEVEEPSQEEEEQQEQEEASLTDVPPDDRVDEAEEEEGNDRVVVVVVVVIVVCVEESPSHPLARFLLDTGFRSPRFPRLEGCDGAAKRGWWWCGGGGSGREKWHRLLPSSWLVYRTMAVRCSCTNCTTRSTNRRTPCSAIHRMEGSPRKDGSDNCRMVANRFDFPP